ncbi:MAG: arginase family protein [Thermomicrobiales bacterium]
MAFRFNVTFSPDWDTDIQKMTARDLGDIAGSLTNVETAHRNIEDTIAGVLGLGQPFVPIIVGGDHSITAPAIRGSRRPTPEKDRGDQLRRAYGCAQFRLRQSQRHPFRQIIERAPNIEPANFVEVGIHGFMNSSTYYKELLDQGTRIITGREVEKRGMEACAAEALELAGNGTDLIYVSVDIDCLAYPFTIGTSAASRGPKRLAVARSDVAVRPASQSGGHGRRRNRSHARRERSHSALWLQRDPHVPRGSLSPALRRSGLLTTRRAACHRSSPRDSTTSPSSAAMRARPCASIGISSGSRW